MHILGLPTDIFNVYPASIKYKTYQARWQIGDIYVSGDARKTEDNPQGLGCYLVMTGRGCDDIFRILDSRNCTFGDMFKHCERRYGQDNFHFTRLDIAIDDKNEKPFFTIEQIKKKCEKEEFISNSEGYHFDGNQRNRRQSSASQSQVSQSQVLQLQQAGSAHAIFRALDLSLARDRKSVV